MTTVNRTQTGGSVPVLIFGVVLFLTTTISVGLTWWITSTATATLEHNHGEEIEHLQSQINNLVSLLSSTAIDNGDGINENHHSIEKYKSVLHADDVLHDENALVMKNTQHRNLQTPSGDSFTWAADFGLDGTGNVDDTAALQAALDSAVAAGSGGGGTVILPAGIFLTTSPLRIPGGVTLKGQGYGSSPLQLRFDSGSSTIAYCGSDYALDVNGHASSIQDLAVFDYNVAKPSLNLACDTIEAIGGVLIHARDNVGRESVSMSNVLIYQFMGGTALTLLATNGSGIAYGSFQNLRIRHAKNGIVMQADGIGNSFVNSNTFIGGAISGAITEVAIHALGPGACNDNKFIGMVVEPPSTNIAHVVVDGPKTNIVMRDVRLEGTQMPSDKPLVVIDDSSYGNEMTGLIGHTFIQADRNRNPGIDMMSAKTIGLDAAPLNQFWNSAFKGFNPSSSTMPGWSMTGNGVALVLPEETTTSTPLFADHNILSVDHYGSNEFRLSADILPKSPAHSYATFGIYARSSVPGAVTAAMRHESGSIIASSQHSGSGNWEFIGMTALYDKSAPLFYFSITGDAHLTAPTFVYGKAPATPGASFLSSSGAKMSGTFTMGMSTALPPPETGSGSSDIWTIPKNEGNIFVMNMNGNPNRLIRRINHLTSNRFPSGTVVTLLFAEAGTIVRDIGYIQLKNRADFTSTINSSLTLVANGNGTWKEIQRNN